MSASRLSNKGVAGLLRSGSLSEEGRLLDQRGSIRLKTVLWVLVLASLLYGAYKLLPPYISFYMVKVDVEEQAKIAHMYDDEALAGRILKNAEAWSVPLTMEDIEIVRYRTSIAVTVRYTDTVVFFGRFVKVIPHVIVVESDLKEPSGVLQ